jgi:cyclophilin family peptidyl-prolyl cis-trans isomerase
MANKYKAAPDLTIDLSKTYKATLHTSAGDIEMDLHAADAPQTVNNFVFLAGEGFYDGVIFHRVIPGFMIQGGDPTGTGSGGPGYKFRDELGHSKSSYKRGTVAMANSGPNTNGSQFFIMHADYGLPNAYSIFGQVTSGLDAVDAIADAPKGAQDRPKDPVTIDSIDIEVS